MNKQGFGYIPKKGKKAFVQTKTTFVKSSGKSYCEKCKKVGHDEKNCTNKKVISFDSSYILMRNSNGNVSAKFVGLPISGAKKMSFGCQKSWSLTFKDPRKFGYLKELLLFVGELQVRRKTLGT